MGDRVCKRGSGRPESATRNDALTDSSLTISEVELPTLSNVSVYPHITPGIEPLFRKYPYWPRTRDIPGYDPYLTPYSNWGVLKGYQPNDPWYYEFMQPVGLPRIVSVILNGIRLGNNGHMK
ncbi:hypothetical protein D918_06189 [Trichuris suis]|nr:hypothetical protein D918_06189 [Trichuris suis]